MYTNKKSVFTEIIKTAAFAAMLFVNFLATGTTLNGLTTKQVSDSFPNLFTPAGFTFSVWGIIYLGLLVWLVSGFVKKTAQEDEGSFNAAKKIDYLFIFSCLLNMAWLLAWQYMFLPLSVIIMAGLLLLLIFINLAVAKPSFMPRNALAYRFAFGIYFGWITVATIANISALLVSLGFGGSGISAEYWTAATLVIGFAIVAATMLKTKNMFYGLVPLWAYFGILYQHVSQKQFAGKYPLVIITLGLCMLALAVLAVLVIKNNFSKKVAAGKQPAQS